mmetsp:Transcript_28426/g.59367  ORF Transcript_28426/g.59367 Transcript_28426/m.59367 type:complete len:750 (-) Transcript_28426:154-2403(-)
MATLMLPPSPSLFAVERSNLDDETDSIPEMTLACDDENPWHADSAAVYPSSPALTTTAPASPQSEDAPQEISTEEEDDEKDSTLTELKVASDGTTLDEDDAGDEGSSASACESPAATSVTTAQDDESSVATLKENPATSIDEEMNEALMMDDYDLETDVLPGGLNNLGNTCYMASALQMLSSLEPLMDRLISDQNQDQHSSIIEEADTDAITVPSVLETYLELFAKLRKGETVEPTELKQVLDERSPLFCGYQQQDAHEFITTLLDLLDEDYKKQREPKIVNEEDEDIVEEGQSTTVDQAMMTTAQQTEEEPTEEMSCSPTNDENQISSIEESDEQQTHASAVGNTHPATPIEPLTNKRLKTVAEFAVVTDGAPILPTDEGYVERREIPSPTIASSFSELNVNEIGHLLHGTPASSSDQLEMKQMQSAAPASTSPSEPKCKLVGGRMNVELRNDAFVTPSDSNSPETQHEATPSSVDQSTTEQRDNASSDQAEVSNPLNTNAPGGEANDPPKVRSPIDEYLTTEVRVRLTCDSCKYTRSHNETFWHLSLELGGENDATQSSVQDGIARFFAPEQRELKCEKCFCETAMQTMQITKLPRALLLHFKRFIVEVSADYSSVSYRKNTSSVAFDTCMTVTEPILASDEQEPCFTEPSSILSEFLAPDCVIPKQGSQEQRLCCDGERSPCSSRYALTSVVNHIGSSASCGHYTADAYRNKEWLRFNDSYVSRISSQQATDGAADTAYMIMYEMS